MRFDGARAKNQLAVEADVCSGDALTSGFDGAGEVDFGIGEGRAEGQLAAGQDDGLHLPKEHIGQRGGGVAHRIRAVGNDNAVAVLHGAVNGVGKLRPLFRLNVAGIHREHVHRQERHAVAAGDAFLPVLRHGAPETDRQAFGGRRLFRPGKPAVAMRIHRSPRDRIHP